MSNHFINKPDKSITDYILQYCSRNSIRYPGKRLTVAQYLHRHQEYIDGDTLWRMLRTDGVKICPATVYDALNWLEDAGLAERQVRDQRTNLFRIIGTFK